MSFILASIAHMSFSILVSFHCHSKRSSSFCCNSSCWAFITILSLFIHLFIYPSYVTLWVFLIPTPYRDHVDFFFPKLVKCDPSDSLRTLIALFPLSWGGPFSLKIVKNIARSGPNSPQTDFREIARHRQRRQLTHYMRAEFRVITWPWRTLIRLNVAYFCWRVNLLHFVGVKKMKRAKLKVRSWYKPIIRRVARFLQRNLFKMLF